MTGSGQIMRTPVEDVSVVGRNTMGVIVMDAEEGDRMANVDVVPAGVVERSEAGDADE